MRYLKYFNENKSDEHYEILPHNSPEIFSNYKELPFEKYENSKISVGLLILTAEAKKFDDEWFRSNTNDFNQDVKWFRCDGFEGLLKFLEDKMSEFRSL